MKDSAHDLPQGIATRHFEGRGGQWNWLSLALLSALMLAALLGAFGGGKSRPLVTQAAAARLEVTVPRRIRNGEFFEMRIRIEAKQPIGRAVLVVPASLWRDMTINTMIPAPSEETAQRGEFRFDYGELKAGETLDIKVDGQINPPLFAGTRGTIALADDDRTLASVPLDIRVLP
ncbi:hypothetical protein [Sphingomonas turrisvirgatae]|uniref:Uncharacterized protein n=1 Tax=Sphingomonas turrisvirgatae TaxID=1888892 RepID=A0A1E3LTA7_9SPHN|nr:hypothetical protein [Sphingomonas turrisvirgatae]ODP36060.1 hypothetical protein BFL28_08230 [Sphingomonas turrisvirgatae]